MDIPASRNMSIITNETGYGLSQKWSYSNTFASFVLLVYYFSLVTLELIKIFRP